MANASNTQPVPTPALLLIHKADGAKAERITKAKREAVAEILKTARVARPELVDYILSGAFTEDETIPQNVIDNPHRRAAEHPDAGWIVPESCLGRPPKSGERDYASTCQSVLLWIKKVFVDTGVLRASQVSLIVVED
jgi:hypothetical protein